MKILQINSSNTYGGGERHFIDLCRGLQDAEQEVHVVIRPACEWRDRLDFLDEENIHELAMLNSADLFSAQKLAKIVRKKQLDVIHAHVARDYPLAAIAGLQAPGARLIITRHLMFRLKNINKLILRKVDAAIGVSEPVAERLRDIFPKEKVVCVHNGLDVQNHTADEATELVKDFRFQHDIDYDAPLVTHVGELKKLKGHHDFIRAAALVAERIPTAKFVIIGRDTTSDQKIKSELTSLAGSLNLTEKIVFIDWLDDITPAILASNVFASCSHSESFGLTVLEAMANRTAIVATNTDGHSELIRDREEGIIVEIGDVESIAEAILDLLQDAELSRNLAAAAQATAVERFGTQRMIDDTLRVYRYVWNR